MPDATHPPSLAQHGSPDMETDQVRGATCVLAGLGNIGANLAGQLARCGVRRLVLIDRDHVEEKNVTNQDYGRPDVGCPKVEALAERLTTEFPETRFEPVHADLEQISLQRFGADVILGGLDSRRARQLLVSEHAWPLGTPVIDGGVGEGFVGRVQVFVPSADSACLECTWSHADYRALAAEYPCVPGGAIEAPATLAPPFIGSVVAGLMAVETIRVLSQYRPKTSYELAFDLYHSRFLASQLRRSPTCRFNHLLRPPESEHRDSAPERRF